MNILPRKVIFQLESYLKNIDKIVILLWPRQVGKTTILKYFYEKIDAQKLYLNLERFSHCEKFRTDTDLISYLKTESFDLGKPLFLFIDEFHNCQNSEKILKVLHDEYPNIKIIASGSLSMEIKHKIQESLAWRKKIFYLYSLDLEEFIVWKKIWDWKNIETINVLHWFTTLNWNIQVFAKEYFDYLFEYMIWWGYPELVLKQNQQEKKEVLESIFDLYLKKDIVSFLNIERIDCFKKTLIYLAINNWTQTIYENIASFAWCSIHTVKNYIEILQESFLIYKLLPFHTNKNKEIKKQPKIYFLDNGVRNWFINNFSNIELRQDAWQLFEWVFYQILVKNGVYKDFIKYWRTKDNRYEIDFLVENNSKMDLFELKFKEKIKKTDWKWMEKIKELYPHLIDKRYIVSKMRNKEKSIVGIFDVYDLLKL